MPGTEWNIIPVLKGIVVQWQKQHIDYSIGAKTMGWQPGVETVKKVCFERAGVTIVLFRAVSAELNFFLDLVDGNHERVNKS